MKFQLTAVFLSGLMAQTALAGYNCKCQYKNEQGQDLQFNELTQQVCEVLAGQKASDIGGGIPILGNILGKIVSDAKYLGDKANHQCSSPTNQIDSGAFVKACAQLGVPTTPYGGAFCWK